MNYVLKKAIEKLNKLGINHRILDLGGKAFTTKDVEKLSDVNPKEICKTLVFKTNNGEIFAVMLSGQKRIDNRKLRQLVNAEKTRMLNPEELKVGTGFEPGTVCPLLIDDIPFYIDKSVFTTEKINFGSGDLHYGIETLAKDVLKCVDAEIVDITQ